MKYLKLFENFKSSIVEDIKEILLPFEDDGYKIDIFDTELDLIYIKLGCQNKLSEDVDHLVSFMKSEGYEHFIGKAVKDQTDISFFKSSEKNKEIEDFFIEKTKDLVRKTSKESPGDIFFVDPVKNEPVMRQDLKSGHFWILYGGFWSVFESKYKLNDQQIQCFMRYLLLGKHLKLESLTPQQSHLSTFWE
jgi:hypothetical protein